MYQLGKGLMFMEPWHNLDRLNQNQSDLSLPEEPEVRPQEH